MSFWWTDFKVRMPFLGLIARESRKDVTDGPRGWKTAEDRLCSSYKKYFAQIDEFSFKERIEYMKHSGDLGRTPMSTGLKIFLFILIAAEAMGFSYILGTWAASDGTANLYTQLMYGIVFVLASILAMVTHKAGAQYYRTSLIRSCYKRYKETNGKDYSSAIIALGDPQGNDAKEPAYTRTLNRILENPHDKGSYGWLWVAGVFIMVIFIGSFYMRLAHMETELTRQVQAQEVATSNPFASTGGLPDEITKPQQDVDRRARDDERINTTIEGVSAFIILGFIFVVTQIVGFGAGHKHSFAGKETLKPVDGRHGFWIFKEKDGAYADTWGYSTYDSYWKAIQPMKDIVNERLKALQHNLKERSHANLDLSKTFEDYLHEEALRAMPRPVASVSQTSTVDKAKADISAMTDKAQQQTYFMSLDDAVKEQLKPWLKERKEAAETEAKKQAELDDLF